MSAIAARQARTPTTSAAAYRPATAALDQSPDLSAIPAAQLLGSSLDRPLHAPTTPAQVTNPIRQSQYSHRTPPAAVLKSP
jgi:hypothetical protein